MAQLFTRYRLLTALTLTLLAAAGCSEPETPGVTDAHGAGDQSAEPDQATAASDAGVDSGSVDAGPVDAGPTGEPPTPEFQPFCRSGVWTDDLQAATVGALSGTYKGVLSGVGPGKPFTKGVMEIMKIVPDQPFLMTHIRAAFAVGVGKVRLRVMHAYGRSYPGLWPDAEDTSLDLLPPFEVEITAPDAEMQEFKLPGQGVFLLPTQHYVIAYEHLALAPSLALESIPPGEYSRALLFLPGVADAYGLSDGSESFNYRLEAVGQTFCRWQPSDWWFETTAPFGDQNSSQVAVADIDGDGHDDIILDGSAELDGATVNKALLYLGDGAGGYKAAAVDPFGATVSAAFVLFGDVDNDGDQDCLSFPYVSRDGDGDGHHVPGDDCNDADAAVHPGAVEVANGKDDDCDGEIDDGSNSADADQDGVAANAGDCDDTRGDVAKGKPELLDGRDNDCDGEVDEDFVKRVLINDGKGGYTVLADSGIEELNPSTAAAFSDANGDGKLDLYWGNWLIHYPDNPALQGRYFTGLGGGKFADSFEAAGLHLAKPYSVYGLTWCDFDNDGAQDLFVGNYHLYPNQMWWNQGDGTFKDVAHAVGLDNDDIEPPAQVKFQGLTGGHTYGADFGDYDNDGDMDVFVCNLSHPRTQPWADTSMLGNNDGAPAWGFTNVTRDLGILYDEGDHNAAWGDFDNDGDLDLIIGGVYTGHYTRLYRNDGALGFADVTFQTHTALHQASRMVWVDADDDGDLDLLFAGRTEAPHVILFVNRIGSPGHWVEFDLRGTVSTRDAVGARVYVKSGGVERMRDVRLGGGHWNVQAPKRLHVGLGAVADIDEVRVRWLTGKTEVFSGVSADKRWTLVEGSGQATPP